MCALPVGTGSPRGRGGGAAGAGREKGRSDPPTPGRSRKRDVPGTNPGEGGGPARASSRGAQVATGGQGGGAGGRAGTAASSLRCRCRRLGPRAGALPNLVSADVSSCAAAKAVSGAKTDGRRTATRIETARWGLDRGTPTSSADARLAPVAVAAARP